MSMQHYGESGYRSACGLSRNVTNVREDVTCARCKDTQKFDQSKVRPMGWTRGAFEDARRRQQS